MLPRRAPADTQRSALVPSTKCVPPVLDRYLCSKAGQQPNLGTCEVSEDFTRHYGQTVYVCQGAAVNDLHGGICTLAAMRLEHDRQLLALRSRLTRARSFLCVCRFSSDRN